MWLVELIIPQSPMGEGLGSVMPSVWLHISVSGEACSVQEPVMTIILTREHFPGHVKTLTSSWRSCCEREPWCPGPPSPAPQKGRAWVRATLLDELCLSLPGPVSPVPQRARAWVLAAAG